MSPFTSALSSLLNLSPVSRLQSQFLVSPSSRFLSHNFCLLFHIYCLMSPFSHLLSHFYCLFLVSCLFLISCLMSPVSCLFSVSRLWSVMSPVCRAGPAFLNCFSVSRQCAFIKWHRISCFCTHFLNFFCALRVSCHRSLRLHFTFFASVIFASVIFAPVLLLASFLPSG